MKKNSIITLCIIALTALSILPVFAQESDAPKNVEVKKAELKGTREVNLACVQTAVEKRETAIISAFDGSSSAIKTALTARKDALKAAWAITDAKERRTAIKKAWNDFTVAVKTAKTQLRKGRNAAWSAFREDIKACKATKVVIEEAREVENML